METTRLWTRRYCDYYDSFARVVVHVGIVSLGDLSGLGGPRGPCGPLSFL